MGKKSVRLEEGMDVGYPWIIKEPRKKEIIIINTINGIECIISRAEIRSVLRGEETISKAISKKLKIKSYDKDYYDKGKKWIL